jgi:hypothetical protein
MVATSVFLRILSPLVGPVLAWGKKLWAERTAARRPEAATYSPIDAFNQETFSRLGVHPHTDQGWQLLLNAFTQTVVKSAPFAKPHVREWLSAADTQHHLKCLSHARITSTPAAPAHRVALIESYMLVSGEHRSLAEGIVDHVVKVLVAPVFASLKDPALSAQLQVSVRAVQERLAEIVMRLNEVSLPEPGWSLKKGRDANADWLLTAFSSRGKAKAHFGQYLCPADTDGGGQSISRSDLTNRFETLLEKCPAGGVVALIGDEGNGKSWFVAQAWISREIKPLTLFLTADDFGEGMPDPATFIARKLCLQTNRQGLERHYDFWLDQLVQWQGRLERPSINLLVVLDGLNQRPRTEWARVVDRLNQTLESLGGKLVVTSRRRYFEEVVEPRLVSPCVKLPVTEWLPTERDAILAARGIHGGQLHERVARPLCNPRLLGIALGLLGSEKLLAMEELSIPLLLFEHMRANQHGSYDLTADHFSRKLQDHARTVLKRLRAHEHEDLKVFEGGLDTVVEGRFFVPLAEDAHRYTVREDGIGLALGLAILDEMKKAARNGRDLDEALAVLAEPIAALDQTSEAMLAALTVACFGETISIEIGVVILKAIARLQNLDDNAFDAFGALARRRTVVFMDAARALALQSGRTPNFDWIEMALHKAKQDPHVWRAMGPELERWLSHLTLDIESRVFVSDKSTDEVTQQRLTLKRELDDRLAALSTVERDLLDSLQYSPVQDTSALSKVALRLMAGMPLLPFVDAFVKWSFASNLNRAHATPVKEFRHLIQFNSVDWPAVREALLRFIEKLRSGNPSTVGRWAMVRLLFATGHPADAQCAEALLTELRGGKPELRGWRLIEEYCSTDPCNPNNAKPDNVARTAKEYAEIDVTTLYRSMGTDVADHFFRDARPAMSRHYPDIAIEMHRALFDDVLHRSGVSLRQGVVGLLRASALVTHDQALELVDRVCGADADTRAWGSLGEEAGIWMQFQLESAFPSIDASDQHSALLNARFGGKLSLNLMDLIKPLDEEAFNAALTGAVVANDAEAQSTTLLFSPFAACQLSADVLRHVSLLLQSESTFVRAHTLRMIARSADPRALDLVLESGWNTAMLGKAERSERWYGSEALLAAAVHFVAPWESVVANMEYLHLGALAQRLGGDAARYFACVVDGLFRRSLELRTDTSFLDIEIVQFPNGDSRLQNFRLAEGQPSKMDSDESWQRAFEKSTDFNRRQASLRTSFEAMLERLRRAGAENLVDQLHLSDVAAILSVDRDLAIGWSGLLLDPLNEDRICAVRNIGLLLACSVSQHEPLRAVELFEKLSPVAPLVRVVFGNAAIELAAMAVWSSADRPEIEALRWRRLDHAATNDALATEVWAALWHGKSVQLEQYIDMRLASALPAAQARGIFVAGLREENSHSSNVLARYADVPGLLGDTQRVASEVYDRHVWALHWLNEMRAAPSSELFWRASVLFLSVADGRVEALGISNKTSLDAFGLHWPSVDRQLRNRFDRWREKSRGRLLAEEAPWPPFLAFPLGR